jgi:hypothetical protein
MSVTSGNSAIETVSKNEIVSLQQYQSQTTHFETAWLRCVNVSDIMDATVKNPKY